MMDAHAAQVRRWSNTMKIELPDLTGLADLVGALQQNPFGSLVLVLLGACVVASIWAWKRAPKQELPAARTAQRSLLNPRRNVLEQAKPACDR
jgi:hypothetical protein